MSEETINIKGDYVEGKSTGTVIHNVETGGVGIVNHNDPNNAPENEELDLCMLLKGHEGETFYSPICGECVFVGINMPSNDVASINFERGTIRISFYKSGQYYMGGECMVFPSKDQHDWFLWAEQQKAKRWRADKLEMYYFVDEEIRCNFSNDGYSLYDNEQYRNFNYFRTEQQAKEAARRVKEVLRDYHEEIGE